MTATLPSLLNGHAPITLQYLFRDAIDEFEDWDAYAPEPDVAFGHEAVSISEAFEALKGCTDIVPANMVGGITGQLSKPWVGAGPLDEMTFSTAARLMSLLVRKRLFAEQRMIAEPSGFRHLNG